MKQSLPTLTLLLVLALAAPVAFAQPVVSGGGAYPLPDEAPPSAEQRAEILDQIQQNREALRAAGKLGGGSPRSAVELGWPLRLAEGLDDYGYHGVSNFVDQNPAFPNQLGDFNCGARTYDQANGYNHAGTDYFTWPFGWDKMDNDAVEIVAAAPGTIVLKADGQYDRRCTLSGAPWNAVYVEHADGSISWYGHMKNGSTTPKEVGETVEAGEYLGVVGSSGNSTGPHLHFEVYDTGGELIDPYEGACNELNATTWWANQPVYYDSALNALMTHDAAPGLPTCPDTEDIVNAADHFEPGQLAYFALYYRDQLRGQLSQLRLRQPDGALLYDWTFATGEEQEEHYAASYWYWAFEMPDVQGTWTFEAEYEGEAYVHTFTVGTATANEEGVAQQGFTLSAVYPNPLAGTGHVVLTVGEPQPVRVALYDVLGREVALVHDGPLAVGEAVPLALETAGLPSGLYVVRAVGAGATAARSFVIQR